MTTVKQAHQDLLDPLDQEDYLECLVFLELRVIEDSLVWTVAKENKEHPERRE